MSSPRKDTKIRYVNLAGYCMLRGINSAGRVPALQAGCQEFESPILHFLN